MASVALQAITANILVIAAAFGYGSWIPRFLPETFSRFTRLVCTLIGGFGLLGLTVFLVGCISLTRWTIGAILAVGVGSMFANHLRPWQLRLPMAKIPAAIVCTMLVWTAVAGLAEPVGDWDKDGVAYHLVGPKVWLRNGVIRPIADNSVTSYPAIVEMVFTALHAMGGTRAPGFSSGWTMALLLAIAASLGKRCALNTNGAWWIAALVITMPAVYDGGFAGFVDVIYAAFILVALRIGLDAEEPKHFAIFGLFCGLAMSIKYPALLAFPVLLLCALWRRVDSPPPHGPLQKTLIALGTACIVGCPFYLRNWIALGFPIYPSPWWVTRFFDVKYLGVNALRHFYDYSRWRGRGFGGGPIHFLALPYNLTYYTSYFNGAGGIGLAPLAFAPLGLLALWRDQFARRLTLAVMLLTILWFVTMQESRYLIDVYAIGAIFAVAGWQKANVLTGIRGRLLGASVVALSLAYGIDMISRVQIPAVRSVLSATQASQWRRNRAVFIEGFDYINHTPCVRRVLILDISVPPYYSDKDYVKPFGQWGEQVFPDVKTTADILPRLTQFGVTHVLDVQSTVAGYQIPPNYPGLELVFDDHGQRIYKVVATRNAACPKPFVPTMAFPSPHPMVSST